MVRENEIRAAETAVKAPAATDAGLVFIGRIRTLFTPIAPSQPGDFEIGDTQGAAITERARRSVA